MDLETLDVPFVFRERPYAIHPHLRPVWRMASIALAVRICSRHDRSSLRRVRVADWLMVNPELVETLAQGRPTPTLRVVRFDPPLERAILYGAAEGLWTITDTGAIVLTQGGREFADALVEDREVFSREKALLESISRVLTEDFVKSLLISENI